MNAYAAAQGKRADPDGDTYSRPLDYARLTGQKLRIYELMRDGRPRTLARIAEAIGASEAGASARIRDLRKEKFGSHDIKKRRIQGGLWEYWMVTP